jgi:hypothetical protein
LKKCDYCGRENDDEAHFCRECGTSLNPDTPAPFAEQFFSGPPAPSFKSKTCFVYGAFSIAGIAMLPLGTFLLFNPLLFFVFPAGLLGFFLDSDSTSWNVAIGWIFYAAVVFSILTVRYRKLFVLFYGALILMLLFNVPGCYKMADRIGHDLH